jgi:type V secretory pathway adhesin AidA
MDEWLAKREQIAKSSNKASIVKPNTDGTDISIPTGDTSATDKLQIRENTGSDDGVSIKLR